MTRSVPPLTSAAQRARLTRGRLPRGSVCSVADLRAAGLTAGEVRAQVAAGRWRRHGRAVVTHTSALDVEERWAVALVNAGPSAVLTSFTALQAVGLRGWERDAVHVLVPARPPRIAVEDIEVVAGYSGRWPPPLDLARERCHARAPALLRAAASFRSTRPAVGIVAAAVTQGVVDARDVVAELDGSTRTRHRSVLQAACHDIQGGAQALSEIDLVQLCRRHGLPPPTLQRVRREPSGRRRYLDASWELPGGVVVGVEVDGAYHLDVRQQAADSVRSNELVLTGTRLLRFPAWFVRTCPGQVAAQLRILLAPLIEPDLPRSASS